ncbi:MAG: TetR/AcrR family transcriptional regulator [Rhodobiaceae bacterium]|nr:TetR/AcrR family transcriptional regulator [Rhodobiaceae bacterium]
MDVDLLESSGLMGTTPKPLDRRVRRSRQKLCEALLDELKQGERLETLSVSTIAARAGVTRKTFYAHFQSLDDVVRQIAAHLFQRAISEVEDEVLTLPVADSRLGVSILSHLADDMETIALLATRCPSAVFLEPAGEAIAELVHRIVRINTLPPLEAHMHDYVAQIVGGAFRGAIIVWAERGFKETPEAAAKILMTLLGPGTDDLLHQRR